MMKVKAHAKLNLGLEIFPKRQGDEYFPVHYIDCQLDLFDTLALSDQRNKIEVDSKKYICAQKDNFAYKAADLVKNISGDRQLGAKIFIDKQIPIKAGFGGGSCDAAAVVKGLSKLWNIKVTEKEVFEMAKILGKDFFYSYFGKLSEVVGEGRNYKIEPIGSKLPRFWVLVVVPKIRKPSTTWVYQNIKVARNGRNFGKIRKLKKAILSGDKKSILKNLTNDFESMVSKHFPVVNKIKVDLEKAGAARSLMAGAGLSVVGFFETRTQAAAAHSNLSNMYKEIYLTKTI